MRCLTNKTFMPKNAKYCAIFTNPHSTLTRTLLIALLTAFSAAVRSAPLNGAKILFAGPYAGLLKKYKNQF